MICFFHRNWKRQAMVLILIHSMATNMWSEIGENRLNPENIGGCELSRVYQSEINYNEEKLPYARLFQMIVRLENEHNIYISPVNFPRIAINFDSTLAPGLTTRTDLLKILIRFLEIRGFEKQEISLVTYFLDNITRKRLDTELPGYQILTSQSQEYFHPDWFHDSPMPPSMAYRAELLIKHPQNSEIRRNLGRKSLLPACLFLNDTYWVNVATAKDDPYLGINGAISSVSINGSSNTERFRKDSTLAPATATEILAIPELWEKQLFSIIDLSDIQIAGGADFNSEFNRNLPLILMSKNPVFLDYHAMEIIRKLRRQVGLMDKSTEDCKLFTFSKELGLGNSQQSEITNLSMQ